MRTSYFWVRSPVGAIFIAQIKAKSRNRAFIRAVKKWGRYVALKPTPSQWDIKMSSEDIGRI